MAGRFRMKVTVALVIAVCLTILPGIQPLQASSTATGSVTFTYEDMQGCTISLYYVADYSETDGYRLSSDFAETEVSRQDIEDGKWYAAAMTMESLVVGYQITPAATGTTDANGQVSFSNLKEGLYLVTIERMIVGDTVYTAQPLLIMIPEYDSDGTANYDESLTITKYETAEVEETTSVSVQKVWDDEDSSSRPASVTVYLLMGADGSVADTQTLNESNNWRYTWSDLDGSEAWYVMEEGMDEYGISYTIADDGTIVLTNQQGTGKTHAMQTIPPDDEDDTQISDTESEETEMVTEDTESEEVSEEPTETDGGDDTPYEDSEDSESSEEPDSESSEDVDSEDSEMAEESESGDNSGSSGGSQSSGSSGSSDGSGTTSQGSSDVKLPQTGTSWRMVLLLLGVAVACFLIGVGKDKIVRSKAE